MFGHRKGMRDTIYAMEWEVLPHDMYSPDLIPVGLLFFSVIVGKVLRLGRKYSKMYQRLRNQQIAVIVRERNL